LRQPVPEVSVQTVRIGAVSHVRFSGSIDERFDPGAALASAHGHVVLDLGAIRRITSFGVRRWMDLVAAVPATLQGLYVIHAPPPVVDQLNMIDGFMGAACVVSVLAPYSCGQCGEECVRLVDLRAARPTLDAAVAPRHQCSVCQSELTFADLFDEYFAFRRQLPARSLEPAVAHYLEALRPPHRPRRAFELKLIQGQTTFVLVSGVVRADLNVRRLAVGVEGRAVYDFGEVHALEPSGAPKLARMLGEAARAAEVVLWRAPPAVLEALEVGALSPKVRVGSLWLPFACGHCGEEASQRVPTPEYLTGLEQGRPPRRRCAVCGAEAACTLHHALEPLLRAHGAGELASGELEDLERRAIGQALTKLALDEPSPVSGALVKLREHLRRLEAGGPLRLAQVHDLVDQLEQTILEKDRIQRLVNALSEVGRLTTTILEQDRLLELSLELAAQALGAERGYVLLSGPDGALAARARRGVDGEAAEAAFSRSIAQLAIAGRGPLWVPDAQQDPRFADSESVVTLGVTAVMCAPLCSSDGAPLGAIYLGGKMGHPMFSERGLAFLESFASQLAVAMEKAQLAARGAQEKRLRERLSRYFSEAVVQDIVSGTERSTTGGEARVVTVLFTDIRGSTSLLERMRPQEAVEMLNDYFSEIIEEVLAEEGTLDKFTGDGIMAFWGAPKHQPDHALRAARASLKIQARLPALRQRWLEQGRSFAQAARELATGIGIHTGEVVVGNIGSTKRMEYTAIGEAVNLAARIQSHAEGGQVLITPQTLGLLGTQVEARELRRVQVKGRTAPVTLHELVRLSE
jgi:class 3 adenylate cyclase